MAPKKKKITKKTAKKKTTKKAVKKKTVKKKVTKKATKKKPTKKVAKKKTVKKKVTKKTTTKKTAAKKISKKKVVKAKKPKQVAKPKVKKPKKLSKEELKKQASQAAILAAMEDDVEQAKAIPTTPEDSDEFDPAAFFAASGVDPTDFRPHVMRKERIDVQLFVRYRFPKSPLVQSAELINLSKGGLCLQVDEPLEEKTSLRIEIPLPHTSELFSIKAEVIWSHIQEEGKFEGQCHCGLKFLPMSIAKKAVISNFIQQRRDEIIMAKIGLDRFADSAPVAGVD